jgi:fucose permease
MELNRPCITFASFLTLGLNGLVFSFMGVSLPSLQVSLEISIQQAGTLVASLQSGFTICTLFGGILSDHCYRERIIMAGCVLLGGGSLLLCIVPSFTLSILAVCFLGAGIGLILSGTNTLLVNMYPSQKGTILNIHHVFFGIGAIVGPAVMGFLITFGNHWRTGYISAAAVSLALCLVFAASRKEKPAYGSSTSHGNRRIFALFGDKLFLVILLAGFLTMGSQVVIMLFGTVFLIQAKQCSLAAAGVALSMFSISMVLGRIVCSRLTLTIKHTTLVLTLLWLQVMILILMWQVSGWFALVILSVSGFTFSGTYPTLLALTSILFPEYEGTSLGLLSTMGGLGTVALCWLTGYLAGLTDISTGFIVTLTACFLALIVFQLNYKSISKRE